MTPSTALSHSLADIEINIRSDKITIRQKGLEKLDYILSSRSEELIEVLCNNECNTTWYGLFESANTALINQTIKLEESQDKKGLTLIEAKNREHVNVIQKIVNLANKDNIRISHNAILDKCFVCFESQWMVKYFGVCYLQILYKSISKGNLVDIKSTEWITLVSSVFRLYETSSIHKLVLLQVLSSILENVCYYADLSYDLKRFLPNMEKIICDNHQYLAQKEVIKAVYYICTHLGLDYRFAVCEFIENIFGFIIKTVDHKMDDESKIIIFKLLHLSVIVHSPEGNITSNTTDYVSNMDIWNLHLRNMFNLIQCEISQLNSQIARLEVKVCEYLVVFGASLCGVIFWKNSIWNNSSTESSSKRLKRSEKLEGILELIEYEKGKFCWRWLAILAQLLNDHTNSIEANDFQPLLQMLVDFQLTIQYPIQIQILTNICKVLIVKQNDFMKETTFINKDFCNDLWYKLTNTAFRTSSSNNKMLTENILLLNLLFTYNLQLPSNFVTSVINTFLSSSIKKTDGSISLIISILKNYNIDTLVENSKELRANILNWLYPKLNKVNLMGIAMSSDDLNLENIAELTVLTIFSKVDHIKSNKITLENITEYHQCMEDLKKNLLFKSITKLLAVESIENAYFCNNRDKLLPVPNELKSVINDEYFEQLIVILNEQHDIEMVENVFHSFIDISSSIALYLNILDKLICYESMDTEKFHKNFFLKRVLLKIDQLNMVKLSAQKFIAKDSYDILNKLLVIFDQNINGILQNMIRNHDISGIVNWIQKQTYCEGNRDSKNIEIIDYKDLAFADKVRYKAFLLLSYFWEGSNSDAAIQFIREYNFNFSNNVDICIVLHLLRVITKQKPTEDRASWVFDCIKIICKIHHRNLQICNIIIELLPDVVMFIKEYPAMSDDLIILTSSFLAQSKKKKYNPSLIIKLISNIKYIARAYPHLFDVEHFSAMFFFLEHFFSTSSLAIKFKVIESVTFIFDTEWIVGENQVMLSFSMFHSSLFERLKKSLLKHEPDSAKDDIDNGISVQLQLYSSILCKNNALRKLNWFLLAEVCSKNNFKKDAITNVISEIGQHLKIDCSSIMRENLCYLISMWLKKDHQMAKFPWHLTMSSTQSDFFYDNIDIITICILRQRINLLEEFVGLMQDETMESILTSILPNCLAYLMPMLSKCKDTSIAYKTNCTTLHNILQKNIKNLDRNMKTKACEIVENLLLNLWDKRLFYEIFEFDIDYESEEHMIEFSSFDKCLEYLQENTESTYKNHKFRLDFCLHHPYRLYLLFLVIKSKLQNSRFLEQKLVHIFQYCVLVRYMCPFLMHDEIAPKTIKTELNQIKHFFIRDITYFFCNILMNSENSTKLKLASCQYFFVFCKTILPICSGQFEPFLNFIVSALVPLVKKSEHQSIARLALNCLNFLIIEQKNHLKNTIAVLDSFPTDSLFQNLRQTHLEIKYKKKQLNLVEEINYFLQIDGRKYEGLVALRAHLSTKKNELSDIYKELQNTSGFSEDCENSILHKLIFVLLQTIQLTDYEKCLEASKCLGELGPADLSTIVLKANKQHNYKYFTSIEHANRSLNEVAIEKLNKLLLHTDCRVLKAVSEACVFLLNSTFASEILEKYPYLHIFKSDSNNSLTCNIPKKDLNLQNVFIEEEFSSYSVWMKRLSREFFDFFSDKHLQVVAGLQVAFAEAMLPHLVQLLLTFNIAKYNLILKDVVLMFFQKHINSSTEEHGANENIIFCNKYIIRSMLNIVECIRIYNLNNISNEIELEYMNISKAAQYCEAHFTSILYAELWALQQKPSENKQLKDPDLQDVMKKAYIAIGEMDALTYFIDPIQDRITYFELNNSWNRIYLEHDVILYNQPENAFSYKQHLASSGLYALANCLPKQSNTQFDCAWRLGDWNIVSTTCATAKLSTTYDFSHEFEKQHYLALKCLHNKDEMGVKTAIQNGREAIISFLKYASLECTNNIYKNLKALALLQQIEDFCQMQFPTSEIANFQTILNKWSIQDSMPFSDFSYHEPILSQRIVIFNSAGLRAKRKLQNFYNMQEILQSTILNLATICRKEEQYNLAIRYLASLNTMKLLNETRAKLLLEDGRLNWNLGDKTLAKKLLYTCLNTVDIESSISRVIAFRKYGKYLADSYSENVKTVITQFFKGSLKFIENVSNEKENIISRMNITSQHFDDFILKNQMKAYKSIAVYSDREYNQITNYVKSDAFKKKKINAEQIQKSVQEMKARGNLNPDQTRSKVILTRSSEIDRAEIKITEHEHSEYLKLALTNYIKTCILNDDDAFSSLIFRIVALWFSNKSNLEVNAILSEELTKICSYHFLPVLPQISAMINYTNDDFSKIVNEIMERCAIDHPQHSIYQILALANANADGDHQSKSNAEPRVIGASQIISKLRTNEKTMLIVSQMQEMATALIQLANKSIDSNRLSSTEGIRKVKKLCLVHCPTLNLEVSKTTKYPNLISIVKWSEKITHVGGINAPKKVYCLCSDGKTYHQLVKGKDDLRQDAVMQQVFTIMNTMLRKHKKTKKKKLSVKTYKVVPLSQRSGILEWCDNTIPLAEYLVGSKEKLGAHQRYYPGDMSPHKCREAMRNYKNEPQATKIKVFKEICAKFQPAFQHFFFENFHSPGIWFERRLAYTNSVATTSMIGYILGIGDRHVSNILVYTTTAEIVHIDFGIAFEQGKCLPTPETVPFRLTRDIVAAFGVSGVEGIFRKSCEKTLEVLRQNKTTILTIVDVLLYDPLYAWTLTNKKACSRQAIESDDDENVIVDNKNSMAERALLRLETKLDGKEEGTSGGLAVEAHVELLIKQATNPIYLCRLYEGWQPYL